LSSFMPELPEVEVTKLGIEPKIKGSKVTDVRIFDGRLRWPVPSDLKSLIKNQTCQSISRRGKYLLFELNKGHLIIHLGMTGVLRLLDLQDPLRPHDRVEICFGKQALRLHDPRKFGAVIWHASEDGPVDQHPLLLKLGVEPFSEDFSEEKAGRLLFDRSRGRSVAVKQFLLAGQAVVGVGNIYCSESLFEAKINPVRAAGKISLKRYDALANAVRDTLKRAIKAGGSSLKDFVNSDGERGHFMMSTKVYGRAGQPCRLCQTPIRQIVQAQRSTFYCPQCQK
jgi:formamidopyrimidine-DNA glycosylase